MARLRVRALLALALASPLAPRDAPPGDVVVVANAAVPDAAVSREDARRLFLLRRRFWSNGAAVRPVNLPATHPLRETFSRLVLERSPRALSDYWNDQYFHGVRPPPVLESEEAVLLYVSRTAGAVGYVSGAAATQALAEGRPLRVLLALPQSPR